MKKYVGTGVECEKGVWDAFRELAKTKGFKLKFALTQALQLWIESVKKSSLQFPIQDYIPRLIFIHGQRNKNRPDLRDSGFTHPMCTHPDSYVLEVSMNDLEKIQKLRDEQDRLLFFRNVFILPGMMVLASLIAHLANGLQ